MRATLTVNLSALAANWQLLKSKLNGRLCAAVVKADAYGLGAEDVSQRLWQEGCRQFFVATLEEGIALRRALPDAKQLYVFHGVHKGEEKEFAAHGLIPVLNTLEQIERWENIGTASVLHVDTGMTRLGLTEPEAMAVVGRAKRAGIQMVMSHLACANDKNDPKNAEQLARFEKILRPFGPDMAASLSNSSGVFLSPEYNYDLARPGCALYGINPTDGENPMRHVATLSAPLLQIRTLDRDETVGYGATYAAKKGGRIAIVEFGYADGMLRALSNKGFAYVEGVKVPFAGRVSMDMIALDVSAVTESRLKAESRAELINAEQTVSDVAALADTIGYEIFTRLGKRVKRLYT